MNDGGVYVAQLHQVLDPFGSDVWILLLVLMLYCLDPTDWLWRLGFLSEDRKSILIDRYTFSDVVEWDFLLLWWFCSQLWFHNTDGRHIVNGGKWSSLRRASRRTHPVNEEQHYYDCHRLHWYIFTSLYTVPSDLESQRIEEVGQSPGILLVVRENGMCR